MAVRKKGSLSKALLSVFVLVLATLLLVSCPSAEDKQAEDMLGTNVELPGIWESQSISYTFNDKSYSGIIQLRFTGDQLQIKAPHGISKVHNYTRNGISITIEDPYSSFPIPFTFALEFSEGTFSTTLDNLEFLKGVTTKLKFTKTESTASFLEPTDLEDKENEESTDEPVVGTEYYDEENSILMVVNEEGTLTVTRVINSESGNFSCDIPKEYKGIKVTSIKDHAFHGCGNLTSIVIPNSITSIGDYAFYGCRNLTSIVIPNSVTTIGDYALQSCTSLTSITIPNSVTSIGERAFNYCTSLTSITIPNSVTTIGDDAFRWCNKLTTISINKTKGSISGAPWGGNRLSGADRKKVQVVWSDATISYN